MEKIFTEIFKNNKWGNNESLSGPSSTLLRTENLRNELPNLIEKFKINTILDAPCGDLNWMKHVLKNTDIYYIGGDIVGEMIENHKALFSGRHKIDFIHLDIVKDELPYAELMITRDFLFHLSYLDTKKFLENFLVSNIPLILTTSHINSQNFKNIDIKTGGWRWMDLFIDPYNFPNDPIYSIVDGGGDRHVHLWTRDQILNIFDKFSLE